MTEYENDTSWVRGSLQPGENLLWSGRPVKVRLFEHEDRKLVPISLVWCAITGFLIWLTWVRGGSAPSLAIPRLFVIPFAAAGLWLLIGRFVWRIISGKKERYALTDRRVIIRKGGSPQSLELTELPRMNVTRYGDDSGEISFGEETTYGNTCRPYGGHTYTAAYHHDLPKFRVIPDVEQVEHRIRQAVRQAQQTDARAEKS